MVNDPKWNTPLISASHAVLIIHASTHIDAPASLAFRTLRNTETWKDWNAFIPYVFIESQPDDDLPPPSGSQQANRASMDNSLSATNPPYVSGNTMTSDAAKQAAAPPPAAAKKAAKPRKQTKTTLSGEPSVRLQTGTRMILHVRMDPTNPSKYTSTHLIVTEVSRPNETLAEIAELDRTNTHTLPAPKTPNLYRLSWASDPTGFPSIPKWLLLAQRVTEIRPVTSGDGKEHCEVVTWECQSGPLAHIVKSKYGSYLNSRFEEGMAGLKEFCETMMGAVERRDFSIVAEDMPWQQVAGNGKE